jgi:hypothetical protein
MLSTMSYCSALCHTVQQDDLMNIHKAQHYAILLSTIPHCLAR